MGALEDVPAMRAVLGLFEGVVTGAADGYARMRGQPAATLLHPRPGLAHGCANLHNARKARSPIVSLIGNRATSHLALDAPLTTDVEAVARPFSTWVRTIHSPVEAGADAAAALAAATARRRGPVSLIVPADVAWGDGATTVVPPATPVPPGPEPPTLNEAAYLPRRHGSQAMILLGRGALLDSGLTTAARLSAATGARVACGKFNARHARGAGRLAVPKLPYIG